MNSFIILQNQVVMYQKYSAETAKQNLILVKMVLECQKIVMFNWTLISDVIFWLANISNLDADHRKKIMLD